MEKDRAQTERIVQKALDCGASLAGITPVADLAVSRSYIGQAPIRCKVDHRSLLVLALAQGDAWPDFDWWDSRPGGTPGNRRLGKVMAQMAAWLHEEMALRAQPLPYNIEKGGIFLKGAAILAGLGTIGQNNLLITRSFGPRVRLRAILIHTDLMQTGPLDFNPCEGCDMPCRRSCPQDAFDGGRFERARCSIQMRIDRLERGAGGGGYLEAPIKYCRVCELACPLAAS